MLHGRDLQISNRHHVVPSPVTKHRCVAVTAFLLTAFALPIAHAQSLPWMNTALPPEQRAALLVGAMTLDQKIAQLHGASGGPPEIPACGTNNIRQVPAIAALQIPTFRITNGPVGIGGGDCSPQDPATALPIALALAASFDPTLAFTFGDVIGSEARTLGLHELEGPGMDMARVGQGGRNFEYFGEDPILSGTMAAAEIPGIQQHGIIAMAKHFILNDQEQNRMTANMVVDDRPFHELYALPFEMAVKDGKVASVMCSYNRVNGPFACDNPYTLTTMLRDQWGFTGYVQSDFGATHSTATSLNAGQDFEMQSGTFYSATRINAALADGSLVMPTIDRALTRRYVQMFKFGIFDRPITRGQIDAVANGQVSRSIAEQTAVLLKNTGNLLPLNASSIHSIALIGQSTYAAAAAAGGGGSSRVLPLYTVTPRQGLQNVLTSLGSTATVTLLTVPNAPTASDLAAVTAAAASADVAIVMAGVVTSEGTDRPSLSLPTNQDAVITAAAAANNPRTVLVLKDGDAVLMPWVDQIPAILEAWNPGEEDGNVVARLLFGVVNPSGKLPVTYPKLASDTPTSTPDRYPGVVINGIPTATYSEGLQMGYRWYDAQGITPLFPFGHGLSYTTFAYGDVQVTPAITDGTSPITVKFTVQNTGTRAGADVPQVYVGFPAPVGEPPKRLVGFQKVSLNPGEQKLVSIIIDPSASSHPVSTWDSPSQKWTLAHGKLSVFLARSAGAVASTAASTIVFSSSGIAGDVNGDGVVNCKDAMALKLSLGLRVGQAGFLPTADIDGNGVVDANDLGAVYRLMQSC